MINETSSEEDLGFPNNRFSPWDYVVFASLLILSSIIGLYYGGCTGAKQKTTSEFLMAGRTMGVFPVAMSLLASFISAITLLGTPAEVATLGTMYMWICISFCLVIPVSAHAFVPVFYKLELTSVFEVSRSGGASSTSRSFFHNKLQVDSQLTSFKLRSVIVIL